MAATTSALPLDPQAPPFLSNPTEDIRTVLTKDLKGLQTGDPQACSNIVELNLYLLRTVHVQEAKIARLESDAKPVQTQFRELERLISLLTHENRLLKQQIALVEDASKILTLRVEGLQERSGENLVTYVASTLSRTGVSCSYDDIDYAKRIGKYKPGYTRPILVKFVRESKRNLILYNRANLNRNSNVLIWINDDISDFTRRQRKTVREIAAYAKASGIPDLKIHGDGLVLGTSKYKHQDLDLLPAHLSVSKAKQISDDTDLYFQSEFSPLSNFYACPIYENDTCYNSAEQAFQHKKALHHDFLFTANKIMLTWDPYELKRLGNLIPASQTWLQEEELIMEEIIRAKFTQNPVLADILDATGELHLHEATADTKWSTGAELSSKAILNGQWGGSDKMGSLLESIRSELRGSTDPDILPSNSSPPPLEDDEDDLRPMPDDVDETTSPPDPPPSLPPLSAPPVPPTSTAANPNQTQSTLPNSGHQPPAHNNNNKQVKSHSPTTATPSNSEPTTPHKQTNIQPLMQCSTIKPSQSNPNPIPKNLSSRAPAAQRGIPLPPTRSPPPQTPSPYYITHQKSTNIAWREICRFKLRSPHF